MNEPINPYQAPSARVADVVEGEFELAERSTRLAAAIIDFIVGGLSGAAAMYYLLGQGGPAAASLAPTPILGVLSTVSVGIMGLNLYLLYTNGQTLGKKLMSIRIVRSSGQRAGLLRIIGLRYIVSSLPLAIPLVGNLYYLVDPMFIFREDRRCIHDLIADTIVIRA